MSENNTARIIELTEIVEEGKGGIQLEDLLADLDSGEEGSFPASPGRPVDPNESLSMPGMNDMDEMIQECAGDDCGSDDELKDLIDDLKSTGENILPKNEKDELDALLDHEEQLKSAETVASDEDISVGADAGAMMHSMLDEIDMPPSGPVGKEDNETRSVPSSQASQPSPDIQDSEDAAGMRDQDSAALLIRLEAMEEQIADLYSKLEAVQAADTSEATASDEFIETVTNRVIAGLQPEIERLSAESAAKIIREELAVLLEMEDES